MGIIERLNQLARLWPVDGVGPTTEALTAAREYITHPQIEPSGVGGVLIEWRRDGFRLAVEINAGGRIREVAVTKIADPVDDR